MPEPFAASLRLAPDALTRPCAPDQFNFATTDDLEPFRGVLGQERAVEALQFGVAMPRPGYNVYVMGEPGTGRFSFVQRYLKAEAKRQAAGKEALLQAERQARADEQTKQIETERVAREQAQREGTLRAAVAR